MRKQRRGRKGEVHIYKPPGSAKYWIRYTVNGRRFRRSTGKETEAEAREIAGTVGRYAGLASSDKLEQQRQLLDILRDIVSTIPALESEAAQLGNGREVPTSRGWFDRALAALQKNETGDDRHVKASSIRRIRQVHRDWLRHLESQPVNLADTPLNRVGPEEVKSFLGKLKKEGFSGTSRKFALARVRAVLGRAVDAGLLVRNPASVKHLGKLKFETNSIRRAFTPRQVAAILEATEGRGSARWLKLSALLGLFTGQRASDICAMRWDHIRDLDGPLPLIHIHQQKTGAMVMVPLARPLQQALLSVPRAKREGFLLPVQIAENYSDGRKRMFQAPWRDLLDSLKLAEMVDAPIIARIDASGDRGRARNAYSFHSWRHTCASYLSGPDAHYLLGHRSEDEKRLGLTAQYRHEDLRRLKAQLDAIPMAEPENVEAMPAAAAAGSSKS